MTDAFAQQPPVEETPAYQPTQSMYDQVEPTAEAPVQDFESDTVPPQSAPQQQQQSQPQYLDLPTGPQPEQMVIEWDAPNRPFKKRNRQYYTTITIIVGLICAILFFAGQFLPIAVVIAVAFLAYVLSAVPPEQVTHRITTYGIRAEDNLYYWEELGRFWLSDKYGQRLLHVEVARFPFQLTLIINTQFEDELVEILASILLFEQPLPTAFDKAAKWLQEKIPLDNES